MQNKKIHKEVTKGGIVTSYYTKAYGKLFLQLYREYKKHNPAELERTILIDHPGLRDILWHDVRREVKTKTEEGDRYLMWMVGTGFFTRHLCSLGLRVRLDKSVIR
jgi:hypothetical protein